MTNNLRLILVDQLAGDLLSVHQQGEPMLLEAYPISSQLHLTQAIAR